MKRLILLAVLFSTPSFATDWPDNEASYNQFVQCSAWADEVQSNNALNTRRGESIDEHEASIGDLDNYKNRLEDEISDIEMWMGLQEAANDVDGYNRNVRKRNKKVRQYNKARRDRNELFDNYDTLLDRFNKLSRETDDIIATATKYCVGKTWANSLLDRACDTYNKSTASYCKAFNR